MLKGNVLLHAIDAIAKKSQTSPNDHKANPIRNPVVYKLASEPCARVWVLGKISRAHSPSLVALARVSVLFVLFSAWNFRLTLNCPGPMAPVEGKR